jgi:hypothetical protein
MLHEAPCAWDRTDKQLHAQLGLQLSVTMRKRSPLCPAAAACICLWHARWGGQSCLLHDALLHLHANVRRLTHHLVEPQQVLHPMLAVLLLLLACTWGQGRPQQQRAGHSLVQVRLFVSLLVVVPCDSAALDMLV